MATMSPAALRSDRLTVSSGASAAPLIVMVPATVVSRDVDVERGRAAGRMTTPPRSRANWLTGAIAVGPVAEKNTS